MPRKATGRARESAMRDLQGKFGCAPLMPKQCAVLASASEPSTKSAHSMHLAAVWPEAGGLQSFCLNAVSVLHGKEHPQDRRVTCSWQ